MVFLFIVPIYTHIYARVFKIKCKIDLKILIFAFCVLCFKLKINVWCLNSTARICLKIDSCKINDFLEMLNRTVFLLCKKIMFDSLFFVLFDLLLLLFMGNDFNIKLIQNILELKVNYTRRGSGSEEQV